MSELSESDKLTLEMVKSIANVIEYSQTTQVKIATGGPGESVKLCVIASLVPNQNHEQYMDAMCAKHNDLVKNHLPMVSSRSDKDH